MRQDVAQWARTCLQCQRAKVSRHTRSEIGKFEKPSSRFKHVHIDLVCPQPPSEGFRYCLTCVDRFSKWPEAFPMVEISAEAVVKAQKSDIRLHIISREQPSRKVSSAVESGYNGTRKLSVDHGTALHINGISGNVERGSASNSCRNDLWSSPIRLPGEFLCPSKQSADPVTFVGRLRESMQRLSPPTTQHHGQHTIFVSKDLATCSHVFLRTDSLRKGLQPTYEGPYKIVDLTEKEFRILRHGKEVSVSIDRLKPAYIPKKSEDIPVEVKLKGKVSLQPEDVTEFEQDCSRQETTTRSGRRVRFNPKYC
ncbi:retrovirus-related Pol polyprotein from transposon 412 [Trichonephila clavipes]|nr:retrovirus-related Pol polyprotein from transposon 412 [Trichonephila clavipes]